MNWSKGQAGNKMIAGHLRAQPPLLQVEGRTPIAITCRNSSIQLRRIGSALMINTKYDNESLGEISRDDSCLASNCKCQTYEKMKRSPLKQPQTLHRTSHLRSYSNHSLRLNIQYRVLVSLFLIVAIILNECFIGGQFVRIGTSMNLVAFTPELEQQILAKNSGDTSAIGERQAHTNVAYEYSAGKFIIELD